MRPIIALLLLLLSAGAQATPDGIYTAQVSQKGCLMATVELTLQSDGKAILYRKEPKIYWKGRWRNLGQDLKVEFTSKGAFRFHPESDGLRCVASSDPAIPNQCQMNRQFEIFSLSCQPAEGLQPGQSVKVTLKASPGNQAGVELPSLLPAAPLKETEPGQYEAELTLPGGFSEACLANVRLVRGKRQIEQSLLLKGKP